ncbi:MAG: PLDc N-terminal domain-containing protein [Actinobacteria bacterium]|nr:PLDc N-terminal domain-containing protein [Actinomycetota bacterium]
MGGVGAPELIIIVLVVIIMGLPIWGIIDAAIRSDAEWAETGQSKGVWILVQLVLWTLGSVVYFLAIRPKLKRAV